MRNRTAAATNSRIPSVTSQFDSSERLIAENVTAPLRVSAPSRARAPMRTLDDVRPTGARPAPAGAPRAGRRRTPYRDGTRRTPDDARAPRPHLGRSGSD